MYLKEVVFDLGFGRGKGRGKKKTLSRGHRLSKGTQRGHLWRGARRSQLLFYQFIP